MKKFLFGVIIGTQVGVYTNPYILKYILLPVTAKLGLRDVENYANNPDTSEE